MWSNRVSVWGSLIFVKRQEDVDAMTRVASHERLGGAQV
jgi:hypothetical protein